MQIENSLNTKNRKLRLQAMVLTIVSTLWVAGMLGILLNSLNRHEQVDHLIESLTDINMMISDYYEVSLTDLSNNAPGTAFSNASGPVDKVGQLKEDIYTAVENSTSLINKMHLSSSLEADIGQLQRASEELKGENFSINETESPDMAIAMLLPKLKEIETINQNTISALSSYQQLGTSKLYKEMVFGTFCVIALFAVSNIWLMILKTLNPIHEMKNAFDESKSAYLSTPVKVEDDNEIGDLVASYNQMRLRAEMIEGLVEKLYGHTHFEQILDFIFDHFKRFLPYNRIGIAILSADRKKIRALSARSDRHVSLGKNYEVDLDSTSLGEIIESGEPRIINDLERYYKTHSMSDSTRLMLNEGMHSSVTLPLNVRDNCVGVVFFSSDSKEAYTTEHTGFLKTMALSLAAAFDQSFLNDQLIVSTIEGFSKLVESKDSETGNHIERMQRYAVMLAEMASAKDAFPNQIDEAFIKQIEAFSPLHDIGKVSIPDHILMKPGKLTPQEFELMKEHTCIGADILKKMNASITGVNRSFYKVGIEIVRHHHEKYNGTGYPDGLSGEDIPLSARIVAVADVLDAITSKRPYKNAFGMETSKRIILEGRNQHFDPVLIDILMENWNRFERQIDVFKEEALESEFHLIS